MRAAALGSTALLALGACASTTPHRGGGAGSAAPPGTPAPAATAPSGPGPTTGPPIAAAEASWSTYDGDSSRTGRDLTSPPAGDPHPAWTSTVLDGAVYAQPLVVGRNVIAATENDTVYSLDASNGTVNWSRHLATPVGGSALPCGNIDPSGITGTPVADPATHQVWVVTFSRSSGPGGSVSHTLWQIDLNDGRVEGSRPADAAGTDPRAEQQRGALTLAAGKVYIPYGGLYGDCSDYHGLIVGLNATAPGDRSLVTYETPAAEAGIWSPPGAVVDGAGDLLVATGNGTPAAVAGDANSVIRLDPSLHVVSRFTAPDYQKLSESDRDLGSISPTIVAGGNVLQIGKEGVGYLLPPNLSAPLETFHACGGAFGGTAVDDGNVYVSCFDGLYAIALPQNGRASIRWSRTGIRPGPPIASGGVVWTVDRNGALDGFSEGGGTKLYSYPVAVAGSFPSLSAFAGQLFVCDGKRIISFAGV